MIIAKPLFALLAVGVASTDAEECGSIPEAGLCSATADILLLVDNSFEDNSCEDNRCIKGPVGYD